MDTKRFAELFDEFTTKERGMLFGFKEREYGGETDKMRVNRQIAVVTGDSLPKTFLVLWLKHVFAIVAAVVRGTWDWCWIRNDGYEGFKQRIADARNYLLLLAASIEEIEAAKTGDASASSTVKEVLADPRPPILSGGRMVGGADLMTGDAGVSRAFFRDFRDIAQTPPPVRSIVMDNISADERSEGTADDFLRG